jgi:HlyD family secretion protein
MTVSLNIETARRSQVILIASDALHAVDKSPWVMLVRDGKTVRQAVQIGLQGAGWSEVRSGLTPGDTVIHDVLFTQENARVRVR